ncbi:MAG: transposase, partial [Acidobacteria bacterium]|nr:transposase [Acidobacteriota bacterium]
MGWATRTSFPEPIQGDRLSLRSSSADRREDRAAGVREAGHTGFSAHNAVTVRADDGGGLERLARYLLRPPLSLERLNLESGLARYRRVGPLVVHLRSSDAGCIVHHRAARRQEYPRAP